MISLLNYDPFPAIRSAEMSSSPLMAGVAGSSRGFDNS
jgi:hypothetical protein